jgi:malate synthase
MEDAATAEICRTQVWQWLRHGVRFSDGRPIGRAYVQSIIREQQQSLNGAQAELAASLFERMTTGTECPEFLTLLAYEHLP